MLIRRTPGPALRPFVTTLWLSDAIAEPAERELVLPTGAMHLVIRLTDHPLGLFDDLVAAKARSIGHAVVGGARAGYYVRDVSQPCRSIGAQLRPGAALPMLGVAAWELAECHTRLDEVWGRAADEARERLLDAAPERQLELFESMLAARLPAVRGIHPAIAGALSGLAEQREVRALVEESGYSHRRFIALFREAVGLTPKRYARVQRFQAALEQAQSNGSWVELALSLGYSDQAHFNREFREFAGVSPGHYRKLSPTASHHVPLRRG